MHHCRCFLRLLLLFIMHNINASCKYHFLSSVDFFTMYHTGIEHCKSISICCYCLKYWNWKLLAVSSVFLTCYFCSEVWHILLGGPRFVTICDRGGGQRLPKIAQHALWTQGFQRIKKIKNFEQFYNLHWMCCLVRIHFKLYCILIELRMTCI